jgi:hypothetical protein
MKSEFCDILLKQLERKADLLEFSAAVFLFHSVPVISSALN